MPQSRHVEFVQWRTSLRPAVAGSADLQSATSYTAIFQIAALYVAAAGARKNLMKIDRRLNVGLGLDCNHGLILNPLFPLFALAAASRRPVQIFLCVLLCRQQTNAESAGGLIRRGGHPTPNIEHRINSEAMNNGNVFPTHFHTHPRKNILDIFATFRVMGAKGIPASDHQITVSVS